MSHNIKQQFDIWAEGSYIDLWTVVHFLAGVLFGFVPFLIPVDFWIIFWVVVALLVLWEVYEYVRAIHETIYNRLVDVLVAVVGFGVTVLTVPLIGDTASIVAGAALIVVYAILNIAGWRAYKRRDSE